MSSLKSGSVICMSIAVQHGTEFLRGSPPPNTFKKLHVIDYFLNILFLYSVNFFHEGINMNLDNLIQSPCHHLFLSKEFYLFYFFPVRLSKFLLCTGYYFKHVLYIYHLVLIAISLFFLLYRWRHGGKILYSVISGRTRMWNTNLRIFIVLKWI